jgi:predicted lipoprotein with Yx(FWY)xxD motif
MKTLAILTVGAAATLVLSACGSSSSTTTTPAASGSAGSASGGGGLHLASTSLGKVLVDASGRTLYELSADGPDRSTCASDCLQFWPAVAPTGHATGPTVKVASTATPGGPMTATVGGHPVYTFSQDHGPGDVNGEGLQEFGGTWYAVSATGAPVTSAGSAASSSSSSSSGSSQGSAPAYGGGGGY